MANDKEADNEAEENVNEAPEETDPAEQEAAKENALRGKRPPFLVFFFLFIGFCCWLCLMADTCDVKSKKDCGWSGISPMVCRTLASGYVEADSKRMVMKIKREEDQKLGLTLVGHAQDKWQLIQEIHEGAVQKHNEAQESDGEVLRVGDRIEKVDGSSGKKMKAAMKPGKASIVALTILRPANGSVANYVPAHLWKYSGRLNPFLLSRGFEHGVKAFSYTAGLGMACWLLTGYGVASLPLYYIAPSAFVAWYTTGCCHSEKTSKRDDPHCFCPTDDDFTVIVKRAWERTTVKRLKKMLNFKF